MEERLIRNAKAALTQVLELREGETFLVVTDEATTIVGIAIAKPTAHVAGERYPSGICMSTPRVALPQA